LQKRKKKESRRDENFCDTEHISVLSDVDVYSNEQFTEVANSF
jgi:hypothetical protein